MEVGIVLDRLRADCEAEGDESAEEPPAEPRPMTEGGFIDSPATDSPTVDSASSPIRDLAMGGCKYWFVEAPRGALRTTAGELTELITELPRDTVEAGSVGYW